MAFGTFIFFRPLTIWRFKPLTKKQADTHSKKKCCKYKKNETETWFFKPERPKFGYCVEIMFSRNVEPFCVPFMAPFVASCLNPFVGSFVGYLFLV